MAKIMREYIHNKSKQHGKAFGKANAGAAMIVAVCVMAVVMILALTLLTAAYQMFATVSDEGKDEMYYQQVMSFSKVLKARLEKEDSTSDELINHIDDFMNDASKETETLTASATGNGFGGMKLDLDKKVSHGNLVVTVSVIEGDKAMAVCTSKYEVKEESGNLKYTFKGYY